MPASEARESRVTFQSRDGVELRGAPVRMTRHQVVFELYSPAVVPQLSEASQKFEIILQGRTAYSGRAVVTQPRERRHKSGVRGHAR